MPQNPKGSKDPNDRDLEAKDHSYCSSWALQPEPLGNTKSRSPTFSVFKHIPADLYLAHIPLAREKDLSYINRRNPLPKNYKVSIQFKGMVKPSLTDLGFRVQGFLTFNQLKTSTGTLPVNQMSRPIL